MQDILKHIANGGKVSFGDGEFSITEDSIHHFSKRLRGNLSLFDCYEKDISDIKMRMKMECVLRMIALQLYPGIIVDFVNSKTVFKSTENGFVQELSDDEKLLLDTIEKQNDLMIFHSVRTFKQGNEVLSFLYVPENTEDWVTQRLNLCNVHRHPACVSMSGTYEFRHIGIFEQFGGIVRFE